METREVIKTRDPETNSKQAPVVCLAGVRPLAIWELFSHVGVCYCSHLVNEPFYISAYLITKEITSQLLLPKSSALSTYFSGLRGFQILKNPSRK